MPHRFALTPLLSNAIQHDVYYRANVLFSKTFRSVSELYVRELVISLIKNVLFTRCWAITDSTIQYHLPYDNGVDCRAPNVKGQARFHEASARSGKRG
jgi:hypothetical protein